MLHPAYGEMCLNAREGILFIEPPVVLNGWIPVQWESLNAREGILFIERKRCPRITWRRWRLNAREGILFIDMHDVPGRSQPVRVLMPVRAFCLSTRRGLASVVKLNVLMPARAFCLSTLYLYRDRWTG